MNIEGEIKKAASFQKTGELEKARVIYEKILELNPGHSECTSLLNLISIQEYKNGKARDFIVRSSQDTCKTPSYCNNLGVFFYKKGELHKAIFWYKKALEENPKSANALNNMGLVYRDQGNPHDAILCYKKAIEVDKGF
ncbi:MAG: tetratricopeptide repeat protein [Thermodesulfobacteriota bacterium]|nr:tetratricopeptide repeat protein [Thermodesulfobacteriota bacterium]